MNSVFIEQTEARPCFFNGGQAQLSRIGEYFILLTHVGQPYRLSEGELDSYVESGSLTFGDPRPAALIAPTMTLDEQDKVDYWKPYLIALEREDYPGSLEVRKRVIQRVFARQTSGKPEPSPSSLYTYYKRYLAADRNVLAVVSSVKKPSQVRASAAMIDLFTDVMDDYYLKPTGALSLLRCYEIMEKRFRTAAADQDHPLSSEKMISQSQFYNWTNYLLLTPHDRQKKLTNRERTVQRRKAIQHFQLDQILERVEVDAATINIGLLDDEGNYLGAPVVYAMIDCHSRAILGIHVQVGGGERASSVIHLYHQLLAPNTEETQRYGCANDWPMHGIPSTLVSDSGPGFSSHQVSTFLSQVYITNVKTEVRKPWKKPFIERFFSTFRTQFCSSLNGYVGKRKDQKELDLTMKDAACMTLNQFREAVTRYIVDDYHQRSHKGLKQGGVSRTPYQVWKTEAPFVPSNVPANADQFRFIKGRTKDVLIQREGVPANGITYQSNELHDLVTQNGLEYPVPCSVLIDDEDISSVIVLVHAAHIKVAVPAKENFEALRGRSLHEHKVQAKSAAANGGDTAAPGAHVPVHETAVHQAASDQKPRKKAKAHNRKANLDAIQQQAELMTLMHEADFFDPAAKPSSGPAANYDVDDEEEYENV